MPKKPCEHVWRRLTPFQADDESLVEVFANPRPLAGIVAIFWCTRCGMVRQRGWSYNIETDSWDLAQALGHAPDKKATR